MPRAESSAASTDSRTPEEWFDYIARLEGVVRDLLDNMGGHSHWREGGAGGVCSTCEQQSAARFRARQVLDGA